MTTEQNMVSLKLTIFLLIIKTKIPLETLRNLNASYNIQGEIDKFPSK